MSNTPTRRSLLAAAVAIPAVAATGVSAAFATAIRSADRAGWNAAMEAMVIARRAAEKGSKRFTAIREAHSANGPDECSVPWAKFPHVSRYELARKIDLDALQRNHAEAEGKAWFAHDPEARTAEYAAAVDKVREYRRLADENDARFNIKEECQRADALGDAAAKAEAALVLMPAPDQAALLWKMEHLFNEESRGVDGLCEPWCAEYMEAVMSDARRLLSNGRA